MIHEVQPIADLSAILQEFSAEKITHGPEPTKTGINLQLENSSVRIKMAE